MTTVNLFQWVEFNQDVPDSIVRQKHRGVIVDFLNPTHKQRESGYIVEVFKDGNTLDVVSVPISWVTLLPEIWGKPVVKSVTKPES